MLTPPPWPPQTNASTPSPAPLDLHCHRAADYLINRRVLTPTRTRKLLQGLGTVGPALCLLYLGLAPQRAQQQQQAQQGVLREAVALLTMTMGLLGLQAGGFASNHQVRVGTGAGGGGEVVPGEGVWGPGEGVAVHNALVVAV